MRGGIRTTHSISAHATKVELPRLNAAVASDLLSTAVVDSLNLDASPFVSKDPFVQNCAGEFESRFKAIENMLANLGSTVGYIESSYCNSSSVASRGNVQDV